MKWTRAGKALVGALAQVPWYRHEMGLCSHLGHPISNCVHVCSIQPDSSPIVSHNLPSGAQSVMGRRKAFPSHPAPAVRVTPRRLGTSQPFRPVKRHW